MNSQFFSDIIEHINFNKLRVDPSAIEDLKFVVANDHERDKITYHLDLTSLLLSIQSSGLCMTFLGNGRAHISGTVTIRG